jgi:hypothetical protein
MRTFEDAAGWFSRFERGLCPRLRGGASGGSSETPPKVSNMVDEVYGVRGGRVEAVWPVAARGRVR